MSGRERSAQDQAYDISAMLRACILACDPSSYPPAWNGDDGIERTLEVADRMMGDLIIAIERLER